MKLCRTVDCRKASPEAREFALAGKLNNTWSRVEDTHRTKYMYREKRTKQRVVRSDGAGRPPEEWQRYDRSLVCLWLSGPGHLSPVLNACATSRSNENSFAECAATISGSTR